MKRYFLVAAILVILIGASYWVFNQEAEETSPSTSVVQESVEEVFEAGQVEELAFSYKTAPDGYVLVSDTQLEAENSVDSVTLFNKQDYEQFSQPGFIGESSPSLSISVFENPDGLSPLAWAEANSAQSNFALEQRSAVVPIENSGVEGVAYSVFGLYFLDIYVFSYNQQIYLLSASYLEEGDTYYTDYTELISRTTFK